MESYMTRFRALCLFLLLSTAVSAKETVGPEPGTYHCRISKEYRVRDCEVEKNLKGELTLTTENTLLHLKGTLHTTKDRVFYDAKLQGDRAFGCQKCQPSCSQPGANCACRELLKAGQDACMQQPVTTIFKKKGIGWTGEIAYRIYENVYEPLRDGQKPQDRAIIGYTYRVEVLSFDLRPAP